MIFFAVLVGFLIWAVIGVGFLFLGPFNLTGIIPAFLGCYVATSLALIAARLVKDSWFKSVSGINFTNALSILITLWLLLGLAFVDPLDVRFASVAGHVVALGVWWNISRRRSFRNM